MRTLEVRLDWGDDRLVVGELAELNHRVYFEYASTFLDSPLLLSPFKLFPEARLFEHEERGFAHVFGVFNDSLPDGWGLLLMDREFRRRGVEPATLSVLDRLAYVGTRGMGALTYHPPTATDDKRTLSLDLETLAQQAGRILQGSAEEVLPELRIAGGASGGARPKILAGVDDRGHIISGTTDLPPGYKHYLIKFPAGEDFPDIGAVEAAYALMAKDAGLDMPNTRLFETRDGGCYFGVERFDRVGNQRLHMHSLGGLLHASHRLPSVDYDGLLKATTLLTNDKRQTEQAFRRMVFNVLAHNRDDHVKNFSFLMDRSGTWTLSPAYDLVFSVGPGGEHTMAVAGEAARPTGADMLRVAEASDVDARRAREIIEQVKGVVEDWPRFARETSVGRTSERRIRNVISRRSIRP